MPAVFDFTDQELHTIREFLTSRYGQEVGIRLTDCTLTPDPPSQQAATCPTVFWHQDGINFMLFKTGAATYRTRFFYTPRQQFSTETAEFTELEACIADVIDTRKHRNRDHSANHPSSINPL